MASQEQTQAATETSAPAPATESSDLIRVAGPERVTRLQHSHLTSRTSDKGDDIDTLTESGAKHL